MTTPESRSALHHDDRNEITVIGAGTIGIGWMMHFLGRGARVTVHSRRTDVRTSLRHAIDLFAPSLPGQQTPAELEQRLSVDHDLFSAVAKASVVLENAPEDLGIKQGLFERIERAAASTTLLLSSTSTLSPDDIGTRMRYPERVVVGHPFNSPHVIPLVEVVPGHRTPEDLVERVVRFYRESGRHPVVLRKTVMGFVANRLQTALLRESIHLVRQGVVTVDELDDIVTSSIGLRWSTIGPFLAAHLAGGEQGLRGWLSHIGAGLEHGWEQLGRPTMDQETIDLLLDQMEAALRKETYEDLIARRDTMQNAVLAAREHG